MMVRSKIFQLAFLVLIFSITLLNATNKTWIGNGTNTSWKKASNWSGGIPGPSDIAIFNGSGTGNCTIDTATVSLAGIQMNAGYTGEITQSSTNTSFNVGDLNAVFSSGIFTANTNATPAITFNGTFTLSGGEFYNGNIIFNNTVTNTSGTFIGYIVKFNSSSAQTIPAWEYQNLISSSTGSRTLASSGAILIDGDFSPGTNSYTVTGSTVIYQGLNGQTISAFNYYNLTISVFSFFAVDVTLASGTIGIAGVFANSSNLHGGTFITSGNTIDYNGSGAQTITAFSYNNLTSSSTGTRAITGIVKVKGKFKKGTNTFTTTGSTIDYIGTGGQTIIAFPYYNLTLSGTSKTANDTLAPVSTGSITIANAFTNTSSFSSGSYYNYQSTINYNGTSAQTIIPFNYYNLAISGARGSSNITLSNSANINIAGSYTPTATFNLGYNYVVSGTEIDFNGTITQTIAAFNYNNLTFSSSGSRTLASTGVIKIAGVFTKGSNAHTITGSTIEFNGTGAQTVPSYDYYNLVVSGIRSGSVTFENTSTISVAKIFSPFATFSSGSFITTGTTFDFNGTLPQAIQAFPYNNLTSSSSGPRAFGTSGTIQIAGAFSNGTNTFTNLGASGESFKPLYTGITSNIGFCYAVDANTIYSAGDGGIILKSTNGGNTWVQQTTNTSINLRFISFYDANNGLTIGASGLVLRTTDGGTTWNSSTPTSQTISYIYYLNSSVVFLSLANGTILKSTDGGATWGTPITVIASQGLYGMYFTSSLIGYVVGNAGNIYKTSDGGNTWTSSNTGANTSYAMGSVCFTNDSTGYSVGGNGTSFNGIILKTINRGASWTQITSTRYLSSINFVDANTGYISGGDVNNDVGYMLKTTDGGSTWTTFNTGTARLAIMKFVNSTVGFIGGLDGTIIKVTCCTDGGTVEFNSTSAQTIPALNYHNLTIAGTHTGNNVTLASSGTIGVSGTLSNTGSFSSGGSIVTTGSTIDFNGGAKNIPLFTFNNATISGTGDKTATGDLTVNGILNINTSRVLNMGTNALAGTLSSVTGVGTLRTQNISATPISAGKTWTPTVEYNSSSAQTIVYGSYGSLSGTGGNRTFSSTDTVRISGVFTKGSGTYTVTGSTIDFNGTTTQSIPVLTSYNNLKVSGTGSKSAAGALVVNGKLIVSTGAVLDMVTFGLSGTLSSTSGAGILRTQAIGATVLPVGKTWLPTIEYNSTTASAQTIVYGSYKDLNGTGNIRTISSTDTVHISGMFTTGVNAYTVTGSTVDFNGSTQSIPALTSYNNLKVSGTGSKSASDGLVVNGKLIVNTGVILDMVTSALSGSLTSTSGGGTIRTQKATSAVPAGKSWIPTVEYNSGSTQTIIYGSYKDLNGTGGARTWSSTDTVHISGAFTSGAGAYAVTGSTIDFNGAAQNIPLSTYNNLSIKGTGDKTAMGDLTVNGILNINTSRILNMGTNAIGGTLSSSSGAGTLRTQKTTSALPAGKSWIPTVEYNSGSAQTIIYGSYKDLNGTGGARTFSSTDTVHISGAFTVGAGAYTVTGSTVDFNGAAQNIPLSTYNNLAIRGTGDKTATGDLTVNGVLNINTSRVLNMGTNAIAGTMSSSSGAGTLRTQKTTSALPAGKSWIPTVEYNSGSAQTIIYGSYKDLNGTGGARTFSSTDTVHISGAFTVGAGVYTVIGSTVDFNGAAQNIPLSTYNNLSIKGTGDKTATGDLTINGILNINTSRILNMGTNAITGTMSSAIGAGTLRTQKTTSALPTDKSWLPKVEYNSTSQQTIINGNYSDLDGTGGNRILNSTGVIGISGLFTKGSGSYIITGSTIDFNGSSSQTIPSFTYNNLIISGTRTSTNVTLASGTIGIAGTFTNSSTFSTGGFISTGNAIDFNGAAQNIPAFTFNNLTCSGTGDKTATADLTVNGLLTINSGRILNLSTSLLLGSSITTSGTGTVQTQNSSSVPLPIGKTWSVDVEYNGSSESSVSDGTYNNLMITGSGGKSAIGNLVINGTLTINTDLSLDMRSNLLSGNLTPSGNGFLKTQNNDSIPIPINKTWVGTVQYNSLDPQFVVKGNYANLDGSRGDRILSSTGTIGISGIFTIGDGNYTTTGSTINFNSNIAQTIPAATYNNLIISGTRTTTSVTLDSGIVSINGNLAFSATFSTGGFINTGNTILFNSSVNQYINGSGNAYFYKLLINKPSGKVLLYQPAIVNQQLNLTKGVLSTSSTNYLQINNGAEAVSGGSDSSYVCGPIKKIGSQAFTFPLGDTTLIEGAYHPLTITAPSNSTDAFTGQYFVSNQTYGSTLQDSIQSISDCEYWVLTRNTGSSIVIPSVAWNSNSCNIGNYNNLRLSGWNGSQWKLLGNSYTAVDESKGILFGSVGLNVSSLPIIIANSSIEVPDNTIPTTDAGINKTICAGSKVLLEATGAIKYSWYPEAGLSNPGIANPIANPDTTTYYYVTGTNGNNSLIDSVLITVLDPPALSVSNSNNIICSGQYVTLSTTGTGTYIWQPSTGLNDSTIASPIAHPTESTNYNVKLTNNNGCISSANIDVLIANITLETPDTLTIIKGQEVQLTAITNADSLNWLPITGLKNPSETYPIASPDSTTTYTVTGYINSCTAQNTILVNVVDEPLASYTYTFPGLQVDFSTNNELTANYAWDFGDGGTSSLSTPTHTFSTAGLYNVCLTVTNDVGSVSYCSEVVVE